MQQAENSKSPHSSTRHTSKPEAWRLFFRLRTNPHGMFHTATVNNEPWFVGKDVAQVLGYKNPQEAVRTHVDDEDKGVSEILTPGGKQSVPVINESGLYSLILSSKLPTAKEFKRWVTSKVLPSIRKIRGLCDTGTSPSPSPALTFLSHTGNISRGEISLTKYVVYCTYRSVKFMPSRSEWKWQLTPPIRWARREPKVPPNITKGAKPMKRPKLTVTVNEALAIMRKAGIPITAVTLADGIETGVYPFGRMVRKSEITGRRTFEIYRVDLQQWLDSKTPKEVSA